MSRTPQGDGLRVSAGAALSVEITGPERVLRHAAQSFNLMGGCQFQIDWGDHTRAQPMPNSSCGDMLRHVYAAPGTYRVHASTYRILPTDSRETDWSDDATVVGGGT